MPELITFSGGEAARAFAATVAKRLGRSLENFHIRVVAQCDSTNQMLMQRVHEIRHAEILVAVQQTAGHGRQGRPWYANAETSLTFSLAWRFPKNLPLDGLSLSVGLWVYRALAELNIEGLALKWPNDLMRFEKKLAGILIETSFSGQDRVAIIGVGLNVRPSGEAMPASLRARCADLGMTAPDASAQVLTLCLPALARGLTSFAQHGHAGDQTAWQAHCLHMQRSISVRLADNQVVEGLCTGTDEHGALLLLRSGMVQRFHSGDVSVLL